MYTAWESFRNLSCHDYGGHGTGNPVRKDRIQSGLFRHSKWLEVEGSSNFSVTSIYLIPTGKV